jgi:hypothetical protein
MPWTSGLNLVAMALLGMAWLTVVVGLRWPRLVVVLSGTTAFGFVHVITEYFTLVSFGGGNGDAPTGFGYLIFATITISAILTVIMTLFVPKSAADDERHQEYRWRPYDAADLSRSPAADRARVPSMPKQLIIGALIQVASISLGVCLGYVAFLGVSSILDP